MNTDQKSDSSDEDEEDKDPDVNDVLVDISRTFHYLQHLRKQYTIMDDFKNNVNGLF